jgi:hypothetical protein
MLKRSSIDSLTALLAEARRAAPDALAKLPTKTLVQAVLRGAIARAQAELPNSAAVVLGRRGGLKGGQARAASLSATQRSDIAKKAARARWGKKAAS